MKIPFDIKYRPQIESGEYKVETFSGYPVTIYRWDFNDGKQTSIMGSYVFNDGKEYVGAWNEEGNFDLLSPNDLDLFIITPEPELSKFEKKVYSYCDGKTVGEELIKRIAAELLELARKQLVEEQFTSDVTKTSLYKLCKAEALKEIEQDPESSYAFKRGVEYGKEEALKDLPRWKKAVGRSYVGLSIMFDENGFYSSNITKSGCRYITYDSLMKLPGFND